MTTATRTALEALVETCRKALTDLLSRVIGAQCEVQVTPDGGASMGTPSICLLIGAEGILSGQAALVMDQRNAGLLAAKIPGASATKAQAVQDLLRQTVVLAFGEFQKQFGATRAQLTVGTAPAFQPNMALTFLAGDGASEQLRIQLLLSSEIVNSTPQPIEGASSMAATGVQPARTAAPDVAQPGNLHLVMGVEVEVTLRFGQRKLPLRQLVELNAGSVVELDKRVHEPVELLLRDKVFARGEVVIVEGHYGLRVTEVCAAAGSL